MTLRYQEPVSEDPSSYEPKRVMVTRHPDGSMVLAYHICHGVWRFGAGVVWLSIIGVIELMKRARPPRRSNAVPPTFPF
jgi:hypothetical protein